MATTQVSQVLHGVSTHIHKSNKKKEDNTIHELEIQNVDMVPTNRKEKRKGFCANMKTICCTFKLERQEELLERYF